MLIAIVSLSFYRLFQAFWSNQIRILRRTGSRLEVMYRDRWMQLDNEPDLASKDDYSFVEIKPPTQ